MGNILPLWFFAFINEKKRINYRRMLDIGNFLNVGLLKLLTVQDYVANKQ